MNLRRAQRAQSSQDDLLLGTFFAMSYLAMVESFAHGLRNPGVTVVAKTQPYGGPVTLWRVFEYDASSDQDHREDA